MAGRARRRPTLALAAITGTAVVGAIALSYSGKGVEALLAVLGALSAGGFLSKLDRVEQQTDGISAQLQASTFQDGYRAGFRDASLAEPVPVRIRPEGLPIPAARRAIATDEELHAQAAAAEAARDASTPPPEE